jgi:SH3-like domain-containing protein
VANAAGASEPVFVAVDHAFYAKPGSRMRAAPSTGAEVLAKLPTNASLHAVARSADGKWWQVATSDGRTGYVNQLAVSEFRIAMASASPASASLQLASATRQQGSGGGSGIGFVDQAFDWIADAAGTRGKPAPVVTRSQH